MKAGGGHALRVRARAGLRYACGFTSILKPVPKPSSGNNARLQLAADNTVAAGADQPADSPAGRFVSYPDSPFQLFQPYAPAGDQPQAIAKLVEGMRDGEVFHQLWRGGRTPEQMFAAISDTLTAIASGEDRREEERHA